MCRSLCTVVHRNETFAPWFSKSEDLHGFSKPRSVAGFSGHSFLSGTSQSNVSNKIAHKDWVGMSLGVFLRRNYVIATIFMWIFLE